MKKIFILIILLTSLGLALDGKSTVNPSTGEMAFSLPLSAVEGVNNHAYPVSLNYKAGIQTDQSSGAIGLGFSITDCNITRKVQFLPDDLDGNTYSYKQDVDTEKTGLGKFLVFLGLLVGLVFSIICGPGAGGAIAAAVLTTATTFIIQGSIAAIPSDYRAGGEHQITYNYDQTENRKGFLHGGNKHDLPDIYYINTPWINGQFTWHANGENTSTELSGKFDFVPMGDQHVDVRYNVENKSFTVILEDKTKLIFDVRSAMASSSVSRSWKWSNTMEADATTALIYREPTTLVWHLNRIEFNGNQEDFIDFEYSRDERILKGSPGPFNDLPKKVGPNSVSTSVVGNTPHTAYGNFGESVPNVLEIINMLMKNTDNSIYYLSKVKTPCDTLELEWTNDKYDEFFYTFNPYGSRDVESLDTDSLLSEYVKRNDIFLTDSIADVIRNSNSRYTIDYNWGKKLKKLTFKNNEGKSKASILFHNSYKLRPNTKGAIWDFFIWGIKFFDENKEARSLTLDSVSVFSYNEEDHYSILFDYYNVDEKLNVEPSKYKGISIYTPKSDYWGFYNPNNIDGHSSSIGDYSDFHFSDGSPYSKAWSLKSVVLPYGKKLKWNYESNRIDYANGIPVDENKNYGGGIRVKSVESTSLDNQKEIVAFEYSNSTVAALPFPYLVEDDPRPMTSRGGLYTPSKVVAANVKITSSNSFESVSKSYTTSLDFPCQGKYGQINKSWKYGLLKENRLSDASGKDLSVESYSYKYLPTIGTFDSKYCNYDSEDSPEFFTNGRIKTVSKTVTGNNSTITEEYLYENPSKNEKVISGFTLYGNENSGSAYHNMLDFNNDGITDLVTVSIKNLDDGLDEGADYEDEIVVTVYPNADNELKIESKVNTGIPIKNISDIYIQNNDVLIAAYKKGWYDDDYDYYSIITPLVYRFKDVISSSNNGFEIESNSTFPHIAGQGVLAAQFAELNDDLEPELVFYTHENSSSIENVTCYTNVTTTGYDEKINWTEVDVIRDWEPYITYDKNGKKNTLILAQNGKNEKKYKVAGRVEVGKRTVNIILPDWNANRYTFKGRNINFDLKSTKENDYCGKWDYKTNKYISIAHRNSTILLKLEDDPIVLNGKSRGQIVSNSDGQKDIEYTFMANEFYPQMNEEKVFSLSGVALKTSIKDGVKSIDGGILTTYDKDDNGVWRKKAKYSYVHNHLDEGMGEYEGDRLSSLYPSIPSSLISEVGNNSRWRRIESYTYQNSRLVQENRFKAPKDDFSSRIFIDNGNVTSKLNVVGYSFQENVAEIRNAHYYEAGVLTCDYDLGEDGNYIDPENKWERGAGNSGNGPSEIKVELIDNDECVGTSAILVQNAYGPSKNFILNKKDYLFTAWVKNLDNIDIKKGIIIGGDYRVGQVQNQTFNFNGTHYKDVANSNIKILKTLDNGWTLISWIIEATKDISESEWENFSNSNERVYFRGWVGCPQLNNTSSAKILVKDIRFHPKDATVETIYFDKRSRNVRESISNNYLKSEKTTYDSWGYKSKIYTPDGHLFKKIVTQMASNNCIKDVIVHKHDSNLIVSVNKSFGLRELELIFIVNGTRYETGHPIYDENMEISSSELVVGKLISPFTSNELYTLANSSNTDNPSIKAIARTKDGKIESVSNNFYNLYGGL